MRMLTTEMRMRIPRDEWVGARAEKREMRQTTKRTLPTCAKCGKTSVLSPCRDCCTGEELDKYPLAPWEANE